MSKILLVCENNNSNNETTSLLNELGYETKIVFSAKDVFKITKEFLPDIALIDTTYSKINSSEICRKFKLQSQTNDVQIILITSENSYSEDIFVGADGYITKPLNEGILIATINAHLRIKKLLDILYTNNSELAKSLYQLNVLYNISTQLAGTLDKTKLINIMTEGLEKSLNFSLCSALIINDVEDATLIVHSNYPISQNLESALKLRALVGYKSLFDSQKLPFNLSTENIQIEKYSKNSEGSFDLPAFKYDSLFSSINTSDRFFGIVEILRDEDFSGEDSTYFQTVIKQVSMPLESAILYEEIQKTNKKLEQLEKLKSEFISIVSHELRTPLTAIKNSLDIMLSGKTGEISSTQNNFLSMAKRNVERLSGIINDLLDLSKIEAGKMEYRLQPLNIIEPIEFVKSTFQNLAEKKNIDLSLKLTNEKLKIYGDLNKIEQVLSNLLSNALKFTPEGGNVTITAEKVNVKDVNTDLLYEDASFPVHKLPSKGSFIKISIKDSGIGIKKEDIPKVFDKFQQIESSLSREVGGTGLGLPITKQLIEAHRGKIWVESKIGTGSTFSFIIPVLKHENNFILELDNELHRCKYNHGNLSLIIVEDNNNPKQLFKDLNSLQDFKTKIFMQNNKMQIILINTNKKNTENYIKILKDQFCLNLLGLSNYPEDALNSEELIEKANRTINNFL